MKNFKNKIHNDNDDKKFVPRERQPKGLHVLVRDGDVMKAYRKLKKKVKNAGIMEDLKDKQYYRKPSEIKREKRKKAKRLQRKLQAQADDNRLMGRKNRR